MKQYKKRVLLIEPPFNRLYKNTHSLHLFPLSLAYLSGTITNRTDWKVMAYNSDFNPDYEFLDNKYLSGPGFESYLKNLKNFASPIWDEIRQVIREFSPIVVGISSKTQNFVSACIVAKLVKEICGSTLVIVGGPHPSMVGPEVLVDCKDIDVAVRGEGEETIIELLAAIESGSEFDTIHGIVFNKNGKVIENQPRNNIKNLDVLAFPHEIAPLVLKDYHQYPLTAFMNIFTIRGCPYNCMFCGSRHVWSRKVRYRSIENIIQEIKGLQKMGLELIRFDDDTFGVNKKRIIDLCQAIIKNCPNLKWHCEIHVKLVDDQTIALMKRAGCCLIQIGIESGNNEMLKMVNKTFKIEEALTACKIIKKYNIELQAFFIIGFPHDTEETLHDTMMAMKKSHCDLVICSTFTPYPGTESFGLCREHGLISDDYDVSLFNHHSPANCFCINIKPERFRQLADQIEHDIDKKIKLNRLKYSLSLKSIKRIKELGLKKTLQKAFNLVR